jgi:hypothetical protein
MSAKAFHRCAGMLRQYSEGDRLLRRAAEHVRHDRKALALIASCMLKIPRLRDPRQFESLSKLAKEA